MKLYEIETIAVEPYFRKMKVESGYLYNFWDIETQDYTTEWVYVPEKKR